MDDEMVAEEEQEAPVPAVTLVNNFLSSLFPNFEVYNNNLQFCNSNGLYVHRSYISKHFERAIFE